MCEKGWDWVNLGENPISPMWKKHSKNFFDQIGQFIMCHGPLWAKFSAKCRFWQWQGVHTGFSSRLGPHGFPLRWLWSCQWDFPLVWIPVRFVSFW